MSPLCWLDLHPRTSLVLRGVGHLLGFAVLTTLAIVVFAGVAGVIGLVFVTPILATVSPGSELSVDRALASVAPYAITGGAVALIWMLRRFIAQIDVAGPADRRNRAQFAREIVLQTLAVHLLGGKVEGLWLGLVSGGGFSEEVSRLETNHCDRARIELVKEIIVLLDDDGHLDNSVPRPLNSFLLDPANNESNRSLDRIGVCAQRSVTREALVQTNAVPSEPVTSADVEEVIRKGVLTAQRVIWAVSSETREKIEAELLRGGRMRGARFEELLTDEVVPPARVAV